MSMRKFLKNGISLLVAIFLLNFLMNGVLAQTQVLPNEMGLIPVMEYHRLGSGERAWTRSIDNFKKDLEWYYANDYRLISVEDFIEQKINVPYGKKPIIFTFDDSTDSQFKMLSDGEVDPFSAVGIMDEFAKKHPDFGTGGMFFILPSAFEQPEFRKDKINYLLTTGREIGNHTVTHPNLAKMESAQIMAELGGLIVKLEEYAGRKLKITSLAYPFGGVPKDNAIGAVKAGKFNDLKYINKTAFLVGANPAHPPYSQKFDFLRIPRIQADDAEFKRWFGREPGQTEKTDKEVFYPLVSDGNQDVLSIPSARDSMLDKTKVREGVKVCVYQREEEVKKCLEEQATKEEEQATSAQVAHATKEEEQINKKQEIKLEGREQGETVEDNEADTKVGGKDNTKVSGGGKVDFTIASFTNLGIRATKQVFDLYEYVKKKVPEFEVRSLPTDLVMDGSKVIYEVKEGDTLKGVAQKFLYITKYYLAGQLSEALKAENKITSIKIGDKLVVPGVELIIWDKKPNIVFKKGIYWTGYTAGSSGALISLESLKKVSGNMVVFDIKEIAGKVFYDSQIPLVKELGGVQLQIADLKKLVRLLHQNGIYVVARQVMFKDYFLAKVRPAWAPKIRGTNTPWSNKEGVVWMDPSHPEVQNYNLAIAKEVASLGVDEIQFDYIRFPEIGQVNQAQYVFESTPGMTKEDVIAEFLKKAYTELKPRGVKLGVDLFGVVAWSKLDASIVGQDVSKIGDYVDVIYPMVYPSHFGAGYAGHANPGGEPYFFVSESSKKFLKLVEGKGTQIVPWIQGFSWGATGFGTNYVKEQIRAAKDLKLGGYTIWSAGNKYEVSWPAMR